MRSRTRKSIAASVLTLAIHPFDALAQTVFSVDFQGPTIGVVDSTRGASITEGDLLVAAPSGVPMPAPLGPPRIAVFGGTPNPGGDHLGLPAYSGAVGHAAGVAGHVEIDAISFGTDFLLNPKPPFQGVWTLSVDEFASGLPPGALVPLNIGTEGSMGAMEACADVFGSYGPGDFPPGPMVFFPLVIPPPGNAVVLDGNGTAPPGSLHPFLPAVYGLGLSEPNAPTSPPGPPPPLPDAGDNLDALDVDAGSSGGSVPFPIYFSLDSAFADPLESPPPPGLGPVNSGSAAANGFAGGDVLVTLTPGSAPVVYASANMLGLDFLNGPDTDDLDVLVLWENGMPGYQPSVSPLPPYDWGPGGADMLLFSVRRGSAIIGLPDSLFGHPIEEGDVLVPPVGGGVALPGLFIAAENFGLRTIRSSGLYPPDDLDALDVSPDCNLNAVPDRLDIAWELEPDCNGNSIPDSCEVLCGDGVCCSTENPCACPADCGTAPSEIAGLTCSDELDNDCDGPADCADADCAADATCLCGNGSCALGENSCTCPADCGVAPAEEWVDSTCADGLDNDCDSQADCLDPDCALEPTCGCASDLECDDGNACTCDACTEGGCDFTPFAFGDADCTGGEVDVDDILCVLGGFSLGFEFCPGSDLDPSCQGDGDLDVDDILAVLNAFQGFDPCGC